MLPSLVRRAAVATLAGLLGSLVPLALAPAPSSASPGCLSEDGMLGGCDDTNPPVFTPSNVTISVVTGVASVTAQASYSDADVDPLAYQCALDGAAFGACGPFPGLTAATHTLAVRAIDGHDQPIAACDVVCAPLYNETAPDYTEVTKQFTVTATGDGGGGTTPPPPAPSGAPETQITGGPTDRLTPSSPVSLTRHPSVVLTASEPATFNCAVNAKKVPCQAGTTVLKRLKPGPQVFVAQAVDSDGNFDATPASLTFYVPFNLAPGQGQHWKRVKSHGSYAGDYVSTTSKGATLSLGPVKNVHEVRLVAPVGPQLGKVAVRIGNGPWLKVSLKAAKQADLHVFELRESGARSLSGRIEVKALKVPAGGAVAVDAIVAR